MIDTIANLFLVLTRDQFIIPLIILGYIWIDRDTFYHATCLILISMIFNPALKVTFQVPLSPLLGKEGFAFPSGHMQSAATFFGWLAFRSNAPVIRVLIFACLTGVGFSLVHFQYHNYHDVLAALFFALLLIAAYYQIITKAKCMSHWIVIFASTILVGYIYIVSKQISSHIWIAYYALLGFIASEKIFYGDHKLQAVLGKIARTIIFFAGVFGIMFIFSNDVFLKLPFFITNLQWLLIGFIVPYVRQVTWCHSKSAKEQ